MEQQQGGGTGGGFPPLSPQPRGKQQQPFQQQSQSSPQKQQQQRHDNGSNNNGSFSSSYSSLPQYESWMNSSSNSLTASVVSAATTAVAADVLENLDHVEASLSQLLEECSPQHKNNRPSNNNNAGASGNNSSNRCCGYITREWGFRTPNGLGGRLGGKYRPYEEKLERVRDFFWPPEAYAYMERKKNEDSSTGDKCPHHRADGDEFRNLPPEGEQLAGNTPLHEFLLQAPSSPLPDVDAVAEDAREYRTAARLLLLTGTLAHLCGNSAPNGPKSTPLPEWIEDPMRIAARRLKVEPTLTGHWLVQENWIWKNTKMMQPMSILSLVESIHHQQSSKQQRQHSKEMARKILVALLNEVELQDRRYRLTVYKNCFLGSQAIDVLMDHDFASSREEAVRLGRKLNEKFHLFSHVTNDHLLKDKFLFYRFRKKWRNELARRRRSSSEGGGGDGGASDDDEFDDGDDGGGDSAAHFLRQMFPGTLTAASERTVASDGGGTSFERVDEEGEEEEQDAFVDDGEDSGDENMKLKPADFLRVSLTGSTTTTSSTPQSPKPRRHTRQSSSASAGGGVDETAANVSVHSHDTNSSSNAGGGGTGGRRGKGVGRRGGDSLAKDPAEAVSLEQALQHSAFLSPTTASNRQDGSTFEEIAAAIAAMRFVKVKDRRYRLKVYRKCFIASQLIDVLVEHECATSRQDAVRLAKDINSRYRIFEHVCRDHDLKDEFLFFRFTSVYKQMIASDMSSVGGAASDRHHSESHLDSPLKADSFDGSRTYSQADSVHSNDSGNSPVKKKPHRSILSFGRSEVSDAKLDYSGGGTSFTDYDTSVGNFLDEPDEFQFDNIEMLYPAFGNNHERVNQLIPACMGHALRELPFAVVDVLTTMRELLEAKLNRAEAFGSEVDDQLEVEDCEKRLADLLYQIAFSLSRCKEQFQLMTTNPAKRTFNSKHISIRQTRKHCELRMFLLLIAVVCFVLTYIRFDYTLLRTTFERCSFSPQEGRRATPVQGGQWHTVSVFSFARLAAGTISIRRRWWWWANFSVVVRRQLLSTATKRVHPTAV